MEGRRYKRKEKLMEERKQQGIKRRMYGWKELDRWNEGWMKVRIDGRGEG